MSSIVIVTNRCFLICDRVVSISVQEDEAPSTSRGYLSLSKKKSSAKIAKAAEKLKIAPHRVIISFVAANVPAGVGSKNYNTGNPENLNLEIHINGQDAAMQLYREMVKQIREQTPDELYLTEIVEKMFAPTTP